MNKSISRFVQSGQLSRAPTRGAPTSVIAGHNALQPGIFFSGNILITLHRAEGIDEVDQVVDLAGLNPDATLAAEPADKPLTP